MSLIHDEVQCIPYGCSHCDTRLTKSLEISSCQQFDTAPFIPKTDLTASAIIGKLPTTDSLHQNCQQSLQGLSLVLGGGGAVHLGSS